MEHPRNVLPGKQGVIVTADIRPLSPFARARADFRIPLQHHIQINIRSAQAVSKKKRSVMFSQPVFDDTQNVVKPASCTLRCTLRLLAAAAAGRCACRAGAGAASPETCMPRTSVVTTWQLPHIYPRPLGVSLRSTILSICRLRVSQTPQSLGEERVGWRRRAATGTGRGQAGPTAAGIRLRDAERDATELYVPRGL